MTLGRLCPVLLPELKGERHIVFGSKGLASQDEWAFKDDTGAVHRAGYFDEFFATLSRKPIYEKSVSINRVWRMRCWITIRRRLANRQRKSVLRGTGETGCQGPNGEVETIALMAISMGDEHAQHCSW